MSTLTRWVAIAGAINLLGGGFICLGEEDCVRLQVVPVKASFCPGEAVVVDASLSVYCGNPLWIPNLMDVESNLEILITAPDGQPIRHMVDHRKLIALSPSAFMKLRPNHFFGRRIEITPTHFDGVGSYGLQVIYSNDDEGEQAGIDSWTGLVKSNRVEIEIVNTRGAPPS